MQPFLQQVLNLINPRNYIELGTVNDDNFSHCNCPAICISSNYSIQVKSPIKNSLKLFRCSSAEFFTKYSLNEELEQKTLDFCFIDNAHHFEALLRDFINLENFSSSSSLVAFDNVLPQDENMAAREYRFGWWMGDVWKIIPLLRKWRPDLKLVVVDDKTTGVALVTNLNSSSTVLSERFDEIVSHYLGISFNLQDVLGELAPKPPSSEVVTQFLTDSEISRLTEIRHLDWSSLEREHHLYCGRSELEFTGLALSQSERLVKRYPPYFIDDHINAGFANYLLNEREFLLDEDFCLTASNVKIMGSRSFITDGNLLFNDLKNCDKEDQKTHLLKLSGIHRYSTSEVNNRRGDVFNEFTDLTHVNGRFFSKKIQEVDVTIDEPIVSLASSENGNYASWLFRFLPKLSISRRMQLEEQFPDLKYFIFSSSSWQKNLLSLMGVSPDRVIHHELEKVYQFRKVFIPSCKNKHLFLDRETIEMYERFCKENSIKKAKRTLLYVSRLSGGKKNPNYRLFVNEQELIDELSSRGFIIFEPDTSVK